MAPDMERYEPPHLGSTRMALNGVEIPFEVDWKEGVFSFDPGEGGTLSVQVGTAGGETRKYVKEIARRIPTQNYLDLRKGRW